MKGESTEERFFSKVDKDISNGCWLWTGGMDTSGYGVFYYEGKLHRAHRVSLILAEVEVGDLLVCHKCDIRNCVNPDHLFLGTQSDNIQDMVKKGRQNIGLRDNEHNGHTKIPNQDIILIREMYASKNYTQKQLAIQFGLAQTHISRIVRGKARKLGLT